MKSSDNGSSEERTNEFEKRVLSVSQLLYPYVKQRLRVAENRGILPRNMFQSTEIINEIILSIYERKERENLEVKSLRISMFDLANKKLLHLLENEKWHKDIISTKFILEEELKQLEENFTAEADEDLIMNEDLDDISYHQNDREQPDLPYDAVQDNVLTLLEIQDSSYFKNKYNKNLLRRMYRKLPLQTSNVVDLYLLGKLNLQEIAVILDLNMVEVKRIIEFVKENFKKGMN